MKSLKTAIFRKISNNEQKRRLKKQAEGRSVLRGITAYAIWLGLSAEKSRGVEVTFSIFTKMQFG